MRIINFSESNLDDISPYIRTMGPSRNKLGHHPHTSWEIRRKVLHSTKYLTLIQNGKIIIEAQVFMCYQMKIKFVSIRINMGKYYKFIINVSINLNKINYLIQTFSHAILLQSGFQLNSSNY